MLQTVDFKAKLKIEFCILGGVKALHPLHHRSRLNHLYDVGKFYDLQQMEPIKQCKCHGPA